MKKTILVLALCAFQAAHLSASLTKGYDWKLVNKGKLVVSQADSKDADDDQSFPSVVKVPSWVKKKANSKAKFYLYYGEHHGDHIKMKWAEKITGPWHDYDNGSKGDNGRKIRGVFDYKADPSRTGGKDKWTHLAAPSVFVDEKRKQFVMFYHAEIDNEFKLKNGEKVKDWHKDFVAFSETGLNFNDAKTGGGESGYGPLEITHENVTRTKWVAHDYAQFFTVDGDLYSMGKKGILNRPADFDDPWDVPTKNVFPWQERRKGPNPFYTLWEQQDETITEMIKDGGKLPKAAKFWVDHAKKNQDDYYSPVASWFASNEFKNHPNNPHKGWIISSDDERINHVKPIMHHDKGMCEVFIYVRGDSKSVYGTDDPYRDLYRLVLDVSDSDWNDWEVARHSNGDAIFDVVCTPEDVYKEVKKAIGGGNINGDTHADPVSMGVPDIIDVNGKKYCFVGFESEDNGGNDSEGQIVCLELISKGSDGGDDDEVLEFVDLFDGDEVEADEPFQIAVDASDDDGVKWVRLVINDEFQERSYEASNDGLYHFDVTLPEGTHEFRIKMENGKGKKIDSEERIDVTAVSSGGGGEVLEFYDLDDGDEVDANESFGVRVDAVDDDGVEWVRLIINDDFQDRNRDRDKDGFYHFDVILNKGSHELRIKMENGKGKKIDSDETITVEAK